MFRKNAVGPSDDDGDEVTAKASKKAMPSDKDGDEPSKKKAPNRHALPGHSAEQKRPVVKRGQPFGTPTTLTKWSAR
jgi:hypothetical protein